MITDCQPWPIINGKLVEESVANFKVTALNLGRLSAFFFYNVQLVDLDIIVLVFVGMYLPARS